MKTLNFFLAFLLIALCSYSQNKQTKASSKTPTTSNSSNNFKGWRDLTWESNEATVKQKYGSQLTILPTPQKYGANEQWYCPFEIHNYELGYDTFDVSFLFDVKTKKLVQVNVKKEDPINIRKTVQDLEVSLTEKYGKPMVKEETPKYISKWSFPELSIELTYSDMKVGDVQISKTIFLVYRKPEKAKLDNF
jgi:hypothetical protein